MTTKLDQAQTRMVKLGFWGYKWDFIFADWDNQTDHYEWLLTATQDEIISWGNAANWGEEE